MEQALGTAWDRSAFGTRPSKFLGQARSWDMPAQMLGTRPLLGYALRMLGTRPLCGFVFENSWDMPAVGAGHSKCLGQARFWDRSFSIIGTCPLLRGTHSWDMPPKMLGIGPLWGQALLHAFGTCELFHDQGGFETCSSLVMGGWDVSVRIQPPRTDLSSPLRVGGHLAQASSLAVRALW